MYSTGFNIFDINGTRLTPPRPLLNLEEQLGCWFDLSKIPMSHQRLIIDEHWKGVSEELLGRFINLGKFLSYSVIHCIVFYKFKYFYV